MSGTETEYPPNEPRFQREGGSQQAQNIVTAVSDISERVVRLVHEEFELARAEVTEKFTWLLRGTVVALAASLFVVGALFMLLEGFGWLAWWILPVGRLEFFWGFFFVAGVLILFAVIAGSLAARAMRAGAPPVPSMALEEARLIRETVNATPAAATSEAAYPTAAGATVQPVAAPAAVPGWDPVPSDTGAEAGETGKPNETGESESPSDERPDAETDSG